MITLNGFQYLKARGYYTKTPNYASFCSINFTYKSAVIFPECFQLKTRQNDRTLYK